MTTHEVTPEQVADALANGREYLDHHQWVQRSNGTEGVSGCAWGALLYGNSASDRVYDQRNRPGLLHQVFGIFPPHHPVTLAAHALADVLDPDHPTINTLNVVTGFNDTPGRAKQEVLDLFARTEKILRAGFDPDA